MTTDAKGTAKIDVKRRPRSQELRRAKKGPRQLQLQLGITAENIPFMQNSTWPTIIARAATPPAAYYDCVTSCHADSYLSNAIADEFKCHISMISSIGSAFATRTSEAHAQDADIYFHTARLIAFHEPETAFHHHLQLSNIFLTGLSSYLCSN